MCNRQFEITSESNVHTSSARCGLDIGGTLAKIVYVVKTDDSVNAVKNMKCIMNKDDDTAVGVCRSQQHDKDDAIAVGVCRQQHDQVMEIKVRNKEGKHDSETCNGVSTTDSISEVLSKSDKIIEIESKNCVFCQTDFSGDLGEDLRLHRFSNGSCDDIMTKLQRPSLALKLSPTEGLQFGYFDTAHVDEIIHFLKTRMLILPGETLKITGGGAHKYRDVLTKQLSVKVHKVDEMESIMTGLRYVVANTSSLFKYDLKTKRKQPYISDKSIYPFLVVNIGSGISIINVSSPDKYCRVSGTCIGGGTVLGLAKRICGAETFDEVLQWAESGTDVLDLKVEDLLGDAAGSRCLPPNTMASSFGRLYMNRNDDTIPRKEDIAWSLVHMVSYNIGYLAYLIGAIHSVRRVIFSGKFVNNRDITMESITHGVDFYIKHYDVFHKHTLTMPPGNICRNSTPIDEVQPVRHSAYPHLPPPVTSNITDNTAPTDSRIQTTSKQRQLGAMSSDDTPTGEQMRDLVNFLVPSVLRTNTTTSKNIRTEQSKTEAFEVLFLHHDGYLGAIGSWLAPVDATNTNT